MHLAHVKIYTNVLILQMNNQHKMIIVAGYFIVRTLLEGNGYDVISYKLRTKWKPTVLSAWKFWPPVNIINYLYVPLQYRVLYVNFASFLWNGYLSYINSKKLK